MDRIPDLYPVFVRSLNASDAWIGAQSMVGNLSNILGYAIFRWIIHRWGEPNTLNQAVLGLAFTQC